MDKEQYLFVMRSFLMQNIFETLLQLYLFLQPIPPDALNNRFYTRWTDGQEVIYMPHNVAAD